MTSNLKTYRAKRDFKRTAEPSGNEVIRSADHARFVVHKHDATRLHFDLRLEHNGVFKSWAVTRGPSLDPADKRLAVEVEDHPLDYGDFEGTIPKGEYGGGTVMLWDRGFWQLDGDGNVDDALKKGELKFIVAGERLKGGYVLVRIKHDRAGSKRTNWLLIKHKDEFSKRGATTLINDRDKSIASRRTMKQIAAGRGSAPTPFMKRNSYAAPPDAVWHSNRSKAPKAGAASGTSPEFIPVQLCRTISRPPTGDDWVHEIKFDGYRMQLRVDGGKATLRTRTGLDWTEKFPVIARLAASMPNTIMDGELVALDKTGSPDFASLQAALSEQRTNDLVYFAFDLLFVDGEDLRSLSLDVRKRRLRLVLDEASAKTAHAVRYVGHLAGSGSQIFVSAREMKLEGIISKKLSSSYRSGRTDAWLKCKSRNGHEVVIGGWSGTTKTLRSLLIGVYREGKLAYTGRVGTGFNTRNAAALLQKLDALAIEECPFDGAGMPARQRDVTWVQPTLVAEIEFAGWTEAGMVRQAAFKGLREDKLAQKVVAEAASGKGGTAMGALSTASNSASEGNTVLAVTISKPDKALWPASNESEAVTKLDLARYLERVGLWMIEHLRGRPCSVIRVPDGIEHEQFFQRHAMPGVSKHVMLQNVSGDRKPYLRVDTIEALISLAQIGAVEFHPWNCAPDLPDTPGRLIFDLDPAPDVAFDDVISAASELRARLQKIGLIPFCKTTGGKGLHVVTPLKKDVKISWENAKAFSQAICTHMANDSPDRYLVNMSKQQRVGRIYLDYLRNDRMSTAVAPLSPRARAGGTISMPLNWGQVKKGLDATAFTVRTAARLLNKNKPWKEYADGAVPLRSAIRTLLKK